MSQDRSTTTSTQNYELPRLESIIIRAIDNAPADSGMVEIAVRIAIAIEQEAKITWYDNGLEEAKDRIFN